MAPTEYYINTLCLSIKILIFFDGFLLKVLIFDLLPNDIDPAITAGF